MVETLNVDGICTEEYLRHAELDRDYLARPPSRIALAEYDRLQLLAYEMSQDNAFGLHMAEKVSMASLSVLGNLLLNCGNFYEAFDCFNRYHHIISDCNESKLIRTDQQVIMQYEFPRSENPLLNRFRADFGLASIQRLTQSLAAERLKPVAIRFEHAETAYIEDYLRIFGVTPEFNQSATEFVFPRAYFEKASLQPNPELFSLLKRQAEELLVKLHGSNLSIQLRRLLSEHYRGIKPSLEQVAGHFNMSTRSLRRHLRQEGASFSTLVDQSQSDQARELLAKSDISIKAIAYQLGFEEPSSFTRAFKRWTGISPLDYRNSLLNMN